MEHTENPNAAQANDNDSYLTFGRYLKKVRTERGLSIEDIMDETRISKYVIQQIEAENLKNLPEDVYLKGFLKAYADALGIDPLDVIEKYKAVPGYEDNPQSHSRKDGHSQGPGSPARLLVTVLVVVFALVALAVWSMKLEPGNTTPAVDNTMATEDDEALVNDPVPEPVEEDVVSEDRSVPEGGLHLEVICVEETTLKITADGGLPEEYILKPEDHLELKAEKMYTILIDNACGVSLLLNGNSVSVPGKCGQTATIQLP